MENRLMTTKELEGYEGAFHGYVLDDDSWQSHLYVAPRPGEGAKHSAYLLYGDLRPAFGIDDSYTPDEQGTFGNHTVERLIREADGFDAFRDEVELDPEGATFFAYSDDRKAATDFADFISRLVIERRAVKA